MDKLKFELAREGLGIATRIAFALLALLVLIIGSTLGLVLDGNQTMVPGLPITFVHLGWIATSVVFLLLTSFIWKSYGLFHWMVRFVTGEERQ